MQYTTLGKTDIRISRICLGTMTFGEQNSEAEAHQQLDYALDAGVNFVDAAEMYPVPVNPKTSGRTEAYIGSWIAKTGRRADIVLATKVIGRGGWLPWIRDGQGHPNKVQIKEAIEGSLKRLQTDYVDLYQIHWPDRPTNYFGQLNYTPVDNEEDWTPLEETLEALDELHRAGKIRAAGVSNETPWGTMRLLALADKYDWLRIASIQNPYSLLNRSYEVGLAEISHREQLSLLAYSPLAFGVLSGKYLGDQKPEGARLTRWSSYFTRYLKPQAVAATAAYVELARSHGIDPVTMALAFVNSQPFVTANIIGATTMEQLRTNIASIDFEISSDLRKSIESIFTIYQNAAP